jgi:tetratricopeptide (TPR) repeat protein
MSDRALSPSALVTFLLDLAKRGFDGSFQLGGRTVVLSGGDVIDVGAAEGDESVVQFLVDAGRLTVDRALALEVSAEGDPGLLSRLLSEAIGREEVVLTAQRATWLDRMIRALKEADERGGAPPRVTSGAPSGTVGLRLEFASLVLDALARRAGERDAGVVGERASEHFVLTPRALTDLASRWAGFPLPTTPIPVFKLLAQTPSAAARLAALVRAGWGRIGSPDELARMANHEAPAEEQTEVPDQAPSAPPAAASIHLPEPTFELDDPIEPHERALRDLNEAGAPAAEIALTWRRIGRLWETELFAIEEAARAYRESAAVDPSDLVALTNAARLCRALGRHDLSRAYAEAALAIADGPELDEALQSAIIARLRTGDDVAAVDALASLAHSRSGDADAFERLARQMARAGDVDGAIESGLRAIRIFRERRPERARYLAEWLVSIAPHRDDLLVLHADMLSLEGFGRAAMALLAMAALETTSADERRARLSAAAERAELERRSDLATDLLARAFDDEPGLDILYEPLAAVSAEGISPEAHAVLLESLAIAAMDDRAARFIDAAQAFRELPRTKG